MVIHMDLLTRCVFLVSLLSCLLDQYVAEEIRKLSNEEDFELEKQLKLINKPPIKTIKTRYGEIYDCIDFYKQSAFDHPLLKNHTFHYQMRPSMPKMAEKMEVNMNAKYGREIELTHANCPVGTVPIRRVTKDDLIRFKAHSERYNSNNYNVLSIDNPGTHYAVVRTKNDPNLKYNGGSTFLSVYNPSVKNNQYSSSRMKIQNGRDSIQAGWTVNPTLYGDNSTRIFIHLKTSTSNCFNTQCPGFVIANRKIDIGGRIKPVSQRGGEQYVYKYMIFRDSASRDWWLALGHDLTPVGFWPKEIFTDLNDMATRVDWGGEVSSPPDVPSPPMGSGYFIKGNSKYDALCGAISTISDGHRVVDEPRTLEDADIYSTYEVADVHRRDKYWGYYSYFGGPGGFTGST